MLSKCSYPTTHTEKTLTGLSGFIIISDLPVTVNGFLFGFSAASTSLCLIALIENRYEFDSFSLISYVLYFKNLLVYFGDLIASYTSIIGFFYSDYVFYPFFTSVRLLLFSSTPVALKSFFLTSVLDFRMIPLSDFDYIPLKRELNFFGFGSSMDSSSFSTSEKLTSF